MPAIVQPVFSNRLALQRRLRRRVGTLPRPTLTVPTEPVDLVFEGGAALGSAYIGALKLIEQANLKPARIAGNSAGAIMAAMYAAGYDADAIEWLCSAHPNPPRRPPSVPAALSPIDFLDFLDLPRLADVGTAARRRTFFWKMIKGEVLDIILDQRILVPTRTAAVNSIVNGLRGIPVVGNVITGVVASSVRSMLRSALGFLPITQPKLKHFQLFDTEPLRIALANSIWSAVASLSPSLLLSTQLLYEGSLFEGRVFLETMERLLSFKIRGVAGTGVTFSELPIPLTLIGTNIRTRRMEVYSQATHPNMSVADDVRRSMSLPVIFEPVANMVVDGGLCSNLPSWLFSTAGDRFWPASTIDAARAKIAFTLDEAATPPASWNVGPGKFALRGSPPAVDLKDVLVPLLIARLRETGVFVPTPQRPEAGLALKLDDLRLLTVAAGSLAINTEDKVRDVIHAGLFANRRFFHVNIPLSGYHGLDFAINNEEEDLASIAERGWFAARDALAAAPIAGAPLIANPARLNNPF